MDFLNSMDVIILLHVLLYNPLFNMAMKDFYMLLVRCIFAPVPGVLILLNIIVVVVNSCFHARVQG